MKAKHFNRRAFLQRSLTFAAGAPLVLKFGSNGGWAAETGVVRSVAPRSAADAKVAIAACRSYGPEVRQAMAKCFDLLGGVGSLVKNKTVTVKLNLTSTNFAPFEGRPVGETFMTH